MSDLLDAQDCTDKTLRLASALSDLLAAGSSEDARSGALAATTVTEVANHIGELLGTIRSSINRERDAGVQP